MQMMEPGQRIRAEAKIGLKTAGGVRDTDSDTDWQKKRDRRGAGESLTEEAEQR